VRHRLGCIALITIVAASLAVWALRLVALQRPLLILAVAIAPGVTLAASLALALGCRSVALGPRLAAVAVVSGLVVFGPGGGLPFGCGNVDAAGPGLVVYSHNIKVGEGDLAAEEEQIRSADPDVVMIQEGGLAFIADLEARLGDTYPHVARSRSDKKLAMAVFSRWPLDDVVDTTGLDWTQNPVLVMTVDSPFGLVRLANVHLSAPRGRSLAGRWQSEFETLAVNTDGADLLVGDFNSSPAHRQFRDLLATGYDDAQAEVGCGLGLTWAPLGRGPSLLHLDHVLTRHPLAAQEISVLGRAGSDHAAILAVVTSASASTPAP